MSVIQYKENKNLYVQMHYLTYGEFSLESTSSKREDF